MNSAKTGNKTSLTVMRWIKSALVSLTVFFICYFWGKFAGFQSFSFAWILNFLLMAWFTALQSWFHFSFNSEYFGKKAWEKDGKIYRYLGVNFYRKLLVLSGWEKLNKKKNPVKKNKQALELLRYNSKASEAGHTVIALIVAAVTFLATASLKEALWLISLNILLNIYPVLVQRYNRIRYHRVLKGGSAQNR